MFYITTEDIILDCSYEEPIYDEHPWVGTYESFHTVTVPPLTGIKMDPKGKVIWCDIKRSFGVSMHPGTLSVRTNLRDRIGSGIVAVSESELDAVRCCLFEIDEVQERREDLRFQIQLLEDSSDEVIEEKCGASVLLSQAEYEFLSEQLWERTRKILSLRYSLTRIETELRTLMETRRRYLDRFRS